MKTKIGILVLALFTSFFNVQAQRTVTTARATSYDISDNLDLDAVASIFGDAENLEDFERRLNDPDNRISNLDLNQDGYIDYLRVVENSSDRNSLVVVQAVLDKDVYQDVATIEVERVQNGNPRIQIVGDPYIYGSNYIIEPVFVRTPLIFSFFWSPRYSVWQSPYYWNNYPRWYSYYRPYSPFKYQRHVYGHINRYNTYHHATERYIHFSGDNYNHIRRSDYATRYPDRAFVNRHQNINNRNELIERRTGRSGDFQRNNDQRSNSRVKSGSQNSGSVNNERRPSTNENRRSTNEIKSGSTQTQPREYKRNSNNTKTEYNKRETAPRNESVSTPARSTNKAQTQQRNSAPREKSANVSSQNQNRSNKEVKQNQRSTRKSAESSKKEQKKEAESSRRR